MKVTAIPVELRKGSTYLEFQRVVYGKKNTPKNLREYRLEGKPMNPVGTKEEIVKWFKDNNLKYTGIILDDLISKDGVQIININKGVEMKTIKLINSKQGWLARFINDDEVLKLFGTDTIPTAFTEQASPMVVKSAIEKLNPTYRVLFA